MLHSTNWKRTFCAVFFYSEQMFLLVETIIQIKVKPFFIKQPLFYYRKPCFTGFLDNLAGESSFRAQWKGIFLANPSIWRVESEFLSIENSIHLFTAFFLQTIISSKILFHQPENKDLLDKYFSTRRRKTGRGLQKMEEKMVSTSRKIALIKTVSTRQNI